MAIVSVTSSAAKLLKLLSTLLLKSSTVSNCFILEVKDTQLVQKGVNYSRSCQCVNKHHCASKHNKLKQWDTNNCRQLVFFCKPGDARHAHTWSLTWSEAHCLVYFKLNEQQISKTTGESAGALKRAEVSVLVQTPPALLLIIPLLHSYWCCLSRRFAWNSLRGFGNPKFLLMVNRLREEEQ